MIHFIRFTHIYMYDLEVRHHSLFSFVENKHIVFAYIYFSFYSNRMNIGLAIAAVVAAIITIDNHYHDRSSTNERCERGEE